MDPQPEWTAHWDAARARWYYHCARTGEVAWGAGEGGDGAGGAGLQRKPVPVRTPAEDVDGGGRNITAAANGEPAAQESNNVPAGAGAETSPQPDDDDPPPVMSATAFGPVSITEDPLHPPPAPRSPPPAPRPAHAPMVVPNRSHSVQQHAGHQSPLRCNAPPAAPQRPRASLTKPTWAPPKSGGAGAKTVRAARGLWAPAKQPKVRRGEAAAGQTVQLGYRVAGPIQEMVPQHREMGYRIQQVPGLQSAPQPQIVQVHGHQTLHPHMVHHPAMEMGYQPQMIVCQPPVQMAYVPPQQTPDQYVVLHPEQHAVHSVRYQHLPSPPSPLGQLSFAGQPIFHPPQEYRPSPPPQMFHREQLPYGHSPVSPATTISPAHTLSSISLESRSSVGTAGVSTTERLGGSGTLGNVKATVGTGGVLVGRVGQRQRRNEQAEGEGAREEEEEGCGEEGGEAALEGLRGALGSFGF